MGMIIEETPETGEFSVEVRSESFYVKGEEPVGEENARHGIIVYPAHGNPRQGTIELLIEDIPKLHACLDMVEWWRDGHEGERFDGVTLAWDLVLAHSSTREQRLALVRDEASARKLYELALSELKLDGELKLRPLRHTVAPALKQAVAALGERAAQARADEQAAYRQLLIECFASQEQISFVSEFRGHVASAFSGHTVVAIDLERNYFRTDGADDPIEIANVRLLSKGTNEKLIGLLDELEDATIEEFAAAL